MRHSVVLMDAYAIVKTLHILSATILFGTGLGIAFFMFASHCQANQPARLFAGRTTVLADFLFTLPAVILKPATGIWLIYTAGYSWNDLWIQASLILYAIAGLCWLPVVWIQIQLKNMLQQAAITQTELPTRYARLFKLWFILGWPAFISLIAIFYLMVAKPT